MNRILDRVRPRREPKKRPSRQASDPLEFLVFSLVMLLRQPRDLDQDIVQMAAERAWGLKFNEGADSPDFVVDDGGVILVRAAGNLMGVLNSDQRYGKGLDRRGTFLPEGRRRQAWVEHQAWCSVDFFTGMERVEENTVAIYGVLARLVCELLNGNCCGLYLPREGVLVVNDGDLAGRLRELGVGEAWRVVRVQ